MRADEKKLIWEPVENVRDNPAEGFKYWVVRNQARQILAEVKIAVPSIEGAIATIFHPSDEPVPSRRMIYAQMSARSPKNVEELIERMLAERSDIPPPPTTRRAAAELIVRVLCGIGDGPENKPSEEVRRHLQWIIDHSEMDTTAFPARVIWVEKIIQALPPRPLGQSKLNGAVEVVESLSGLIADVLGDKSLSDGRDDEAIRARGWILRATEKMGSNAARSEWVKNTMLTSFGLRTPNIPVMAPLGGPGLNPDDAVDFKKHWHPKVERSPSEPSRTNRSAMPGPCRPPAGCPVWKGGAVVERVIRGEPDENDAGGIYGGRIPLRVRMKKTVTPDFPFLVRESERLVLWERDEGYVSCTEKGALTACIFSEDENAWLEMGVKPDEIEVIEWVPDNVWGVTEEQLKTKKL